LVDLLISPSVGLYPPLFYAYVALFSGVQNGHSFHAPGGAAPKSGFVKKFSTGRMPQGPISTTSYEKPAPNPAKFGGIKKPTAWTPQRPISETPTKQDEEPLAEDIAAQMPIAETPTKQDEEKLAEEFASFKDSQLPKELWPDNMMRVVKVRI